MRLLVAAATQVELDIFHRYLQQHYKKLNEHTYTKDKVTLFICITGIGMMQTTFRLMEGIQAFTPHFCLQVGIAGAFTNELQLGQLVIVQSETLGDLGVEDHDRFLDVFDIGLMDPAQKPFSQKQLTNTFQDFPWRLNLPFVSGLTVNTCSGQADTIKRRAEYFGCSVESMEGAAFHYVCLQNGIPFLQVRSISNYITPRDKSSWKMQEAIEKLNAWMIEHIPN